MATAKHSWEIRTSAARHDVTFHHNTLSGRRSLWVDGELLFRSGYRYRLTGSVTFHIEGLECKILIEPRGLMGMEYELLYDGHPVSPSGKLRRGTTWEFRPSAAQAAIEIEFDHESFDILVDRRVVEVESDFLSEGEGEGSVYFVPLPGEKTGRIEVRVGAKGASQAILMVDGRRIPTVEELVADAPADDEHHSGHVSMVAPAAATAPTALASASAASASGHS